MLEPLSRQAPQGWWRIAEIKLIDYAKVEGILFCVLFVDLVKAFDQALRELVIGGPRAGAEDRVDYLMQLGVGHAQVTETQALRKWFDLTSWPHGWTPTCCKLSTHTPWPLLSFPPGCSNVDFCPVRI